MHADRQHKQAAAAPIRMQRFAMGRFSRPTTPRKDETMTVYEVIDSYFRRFGLFATHDKAEGWAKENPLHYFVGIEKRPVTPAENRYRIKEVVVA